MSNEARGRSRVILSASSQYHTEVVVKPTYLEVPWKKQRQQAHEQLQQVSQETGRRVASIDLLLSFCSYGTTQVNVLNVREVPVLPVHEAHRQKENDPFAGFIRLSPSGTVNLLASLNNDERSISKIRPPLSSGNCESIRV
ncbi:hypothetical protein HJC23_009923 [Cyclotella cryptica]|uniref:Uncharacterized protein n=1 Tax=Cyclotella cryptica TaxID=29204 RepID=A0ABD3P0I8_9STRA